MSLFLLEKKNGLGVSALHQAGFNKISTNNDNGFVDGFLNSFNIVQLSSNQIGIDSGIMSVQGFRVFNDDLIVESINITPTQTIPFQIILRIDIKVDDENSNKSIISRPVEALRQDDIFVNKFGIYEVELCKFDMTGSGIHNFSKSIVKLTKTSEHLSKEITLLQNAWVANAQTITIPEIVNYSTLFISASQDGSTSNVFLNQKALSNANIYKVEKVGTNQLKFTCEKIPNTNLKVLVTLGG